MAILLENLPTIVKLQSREARLAISVLELGPLRSDDPFLLKWDSAGKWQSSEHELA